MMERITKELEHELSGSASLVQYLSDHADCVVGEQDLPAALAEVMEEKRLRRADIIRRSSLNDIYVHQIFSGKRRPSRNKLLCLFFGMELDVERVQKILKCCGYPPLYVKNRRDSVIYFALRNGHSLLQANELLFEQGEAMLA